MSSVRSELAHRSAAVKHGAALAQAIPARGVTSRPYTAVEVQLRRYICLLGRTHEAAAAAAAARLGPVHTLRQRHPYGNACREGDR